MPDLTLAIQNAFEAALNEAEKWFGATAPNPPVGAAALDAAGQLLGVAAHERAGTAHAEAKLLQLLQDQGLLDRARTLLVTLEPCNHTGRTPPCVEAILKQPQIRQVGFGMTDPNPRVAGAGAARLRAAGLEVFALPHGSPLQPRCEHLIRPFTHWVTRGEPYVILKTAHRFQTETARDAWLQKLEALIAAQSSAAEFEPHLRDTMIPAAGQTTFTQPASLDEVHLLRRRSDALLTGSGTLLADDPAFTVRRVPDFKNPAKKRKIAILDRRGRTPQAWLTAAAARGLSPEIFSPPPGSEGLREVLRALGAQEVHQVLIEAGPAVSAAFLATGLWEERIHYGHVALPTNTPDLKIHKRRDPHD